MFKKMPAFTLIEILVVATIIILLTAISIASFSTANKSARDAKRKSDIETIRQAMVLYKTQNGSYADVQSDLTGATKYISLPFPTDPKGSVAYSARYATALNQTFCFCADVELDKGNQINNLCTGTWSDGTGGFYCAIEPY